MAKLLDRSRRPLGKYLDPSILKIFYISADLMARRRALGKISKPDPLDLATDKKFPCDDHQPSASRHSINVRWRQV